MATFDDQSKLVLFPWLISLMQWQIQYDDMMTWWHDMMTWYADVIWWHDMLTWYDDMISRRDMMAWWHDDNRSKLVLTRDWYPTCNAKSDNGYFSMKGNSLKSHSTCFAWNLGQQMLYYLKCCPHCMMTMCCIYILSLVETIFPTSMLILTFKNQFNNLIQIVSELSVQFCSC